MLKIEQMKDVYQTDEDDFQLRLKKLDELLAENSSSSSTAEVNETRKSQVLEEIRTINSTN